MVLWQYTDLLIDIKHRGFCGQDHREDTGWQSDLLVITTDLRSQKMKDIAHNPMAEVNW